LGKQRVEAFQVLRCLLGHYRDSYGTAGWENHPVVCQWRGHYHLLVEYYHEMLIEWFLRGYENNLPWISNRAQSFSVKGRQFNYGGETMKNGEKYDDGVHPPWLGMEAYHSSHRATLLAKNPEWYNQFGWVEAPHYQYFWPITSAGNGGWGPAVPTDTEDAYHERNEQLHTDTLAEGPASLDSSSALDIVCVLRGDASSTTDTDHPEHKSSPGTNI
jgi:Pyrimidine dimer DNA glycosylase